ncbi:hypothetical protein KCU91_g11452, partial [Aureobasidium melanogenum]
MSAPVLIEEVMGILKRIPMSQERFNSLKEKIVQSKTLTGPDESVINLQHMTMKCVQDVKERLAYITERRKQRSIEDKQKNIDFAAALAERDAVKESERMTRKGQKAHRTRIEVWRDEVKQHCLVEKKTVSGTVPQQLKPSRQSTTKRPHDNASPSLEQLAGASTPATKRIKTTTQNDSTSAIAAPTSSKKSIPWLSTRASMADENVFADDDRRPVSGQDFRFSNNNNAPDDHDDHGDYDDHDDYDSHDDADEEFDEDEDADSDYSDESYLTELEQMLTTELAMVTVLTLALPRMISRSDAFRQGLEQGGFL